MSLSLFVPFVVHDFLYNNSVVLIHTFRVPFNTISYIQIGDIQIGTNSHVRIRIH